MIACEELLKSFPANSKGPRFVCLFVLGFLNVFTRERIEYKVAGLKRAASELEHNLHEIC